MLSSKGNRTNKVVLEHPWVQLVRPEFVVFLPASQHKVFTHAPRIDAIRANGVGIMPRSYYLFRWFPDFGGVIFRTKLPLPQILDQLRSVKVENVFKIILFVDLLLFVLWFGIRFRRIRLSWGCLLCGLLGCFLLQIIAIGVAQPELTFIISSPAVDKSVLGPGDCVMLTATDLDDVIALVGIQLFDSDWVALVELAAYAQLAVVVESPREQLLVVVDVKTALFAAKNVDCIFGSNFFDFHSLTIFIAGV